MKRAQAASDKKLPSHVAKTMAALHEFSDVADRLRPYLAEIEKLASKVDDTISVLRQVEIENSALKAELALQREVTMRLIHGFIGLPVASMESIRLLESQIQDQILKESTNGIETARGNQSETTESDSGSGTAG
jgi:hypothetical protein